MTAPQPATIPKQSPAAQRWRDRLRPWIGQVAVVLFLLTLWFFCLFLYTRNNSFPCYRHMDEEGKAQQILADSRNYNHPQLLLEASYWTVRWLKPAEEVQAIVEVGRCVSAAFMATAVTALAWAAYQASRWTGLLLVAVGMALCPTTLAYSHYMKEDGALIMGLALVAAASRALWDWRSWYARLLALALLGIACAVATSGKYVGALTLALALPAILFAPGFRWYSLLLRPVVFLLFFAASILAINHRTVDWSAIQQGQVHSVADLFTPSAREGLEREFQHSQTGHARATMAQPNAYALGVFCKDTAWHAFALAGVYVLLLFFAGPQRSGWHLLMLWYLLLCFAVLSFNTIPFHRYAQPTIFLAYFLAALALADLVQRFCTRGLRQVAATVIALNLLLVLQLPRALHYTQQFKDDSRDRLYAWAVANLPQNAHVIVEYHTALGIGPGYHQAGSLPERPDLSLTHDTFAPKQGSLEQLRATPNTYVILCDLAYERYLNDSLRPMNGYEEDFASRRRFYQELFRDYRPIWSCEPKYNMHANTSPAIAVYHLGK